MARSRAWFRSGRAATVSAVTLAEDLLLLAVSPRNGRIRVVERIGIALRAAELIELALAGRVSVDEQRIAVIDAGPLGHPRLDRALASLQDGSCAPALDAWLLHRPPGPGMIGQYLWLLANQGVIRVELRQVGGAVSSPVDWRDVGAVVSTRIVLLDQRRCTRARARLDALAHDGPAAIAEDRALAVVVHACGLDRYLYRGLRGRSARNRLARLTDRQQITKGGIAALHATDAALADTASRPLANSGVKLADDLADLMRRAYRIEQSELTTRYSGASGQAGADGPHMRIVEVDGATARHAVISMRRRESPLRFVLIPMAHVALPGFYEQVRQRLGTCDLIVAEGIRGRTWQITTLTLAYRLLPYRRRHGLVPQDYRTLLPPGVPVVNPDVTAAEATSDLRALGRGIYPLLMIAAPIAGLVVAIRGPRAYLQHNVDATSPSTISGADVLKPNHHLHPIEHALRARRDRQLVAALDGIHDQHHDEPLTVAVVYGAAHIPEVYTHLFARYQYRPGEPEWLTALSIRTGR